MARTRMQADADGIDADLERIRSRLSMCQKNARGSIERKLLEDADRAVGTARSIVRQLMSESDRKITS